MNKELNFTDKKTIDKWDKLGLLDGTEGKLKEIMSYAFETESNKILFGDINYSEQFNQDIFPVTRRLLIKDDFYKKLTTVTIDLFIINLMSSLEETIDNYFGEFLNDKELDDPEAVFVATFTGNYDISKY
jgi:hypothetical protein